jgi:hypothetical protein
VTVFAIDPGPHTGIFWIDNNVTHRVTLDYTGVLAWSAHKELYMGLMQMVNPEQDHVVCESFEFRKEDAQNREYIDYSTGELVGVVKLFAQLTNTAYTIQSASQAKGFWTDDKLKRVGLWVPGAEQRHVRDATRHWLHYHTFGRGASQAHYWLSKLK